MKKINTTIKTAFISEAGNDLINNDYLAFAELDNYACYVIADGITDTQEVGGAKLAVEKIIEMFQADASMSRRKIVSYLDAANKALVNSYKYNKLKASVTIIITDYESVRYAMAGNIRFSLYRGSSRKIQSVDMSLSQELVEKGSLPENALSKHEERNNLYSYLGQDDKFTPFVSPKIKLKDADILTLYTRGIWENIDDGEIDEVFAEASDKPEESVDAVEDLLLSKQPKNLGNYSIAAIFVDQIYKDPQRDIRRKQMIRIAIIICIILLIVGIIAWFWSKHRDGQREEMALRTDQTVACVKSNNYIRASEECKKATEEAKSLGDKDNIAKLQAYQQLIESVIQADEAFKNKDYADAYEKYQVALDFSRGADGLGEKYINRQIKTSAEHLSVSDIIALGDKLMATGDLDKAELRYLEAKDAATKLYSQEDKGLAEAALSKLYDARAKSKKASEDKAKKAVTNSINDYIKMSEVLQASGDFVGAEKKLLEARDLAAKNYDDAGKQTAMAALEKLHQAMAKQQEKVQKDAEAQAAAAVELAQLVAKGDSAAAAGDNATAKILYLSAVDKYIAAKNDVAVVSLNEKLQALADKAQAVSTINADAAKMEEQAIALYEAGDYYGAKQSYLKALSLYQANGAKDKVTAIRTVLEQIDTDIAIKSAESRTKK